MNQTHSAEALRQEYRVKRLVDRELEGIIRNMRRMAGKADLKKSRLGRAQFTNLQNVARDTESVQVILTWIQYQIGRQRYWRDEDFGKKLIDELEGLEGVAKDIADEATDGEPGEDLIRLTWLRLIRQYIGQLQRFVVALQGGDL